MEKVMMDIKKLKKYLYSLDTLNYELSFYGEYVPIFLFNTVTTKNWIDFSV